MSAPLADRGSFWRWMRVGCELLTPAERTKGIVLSVVMLVRGLLATAVVLSAIPMIHLIVQPASLTTDPMLSLLHRLAGSPPLSSFVWLLAGGILVLTVGGGMADWASYYLVHRYVRSCENRVAKELFASVMAAPYRWFLTRHHTSLSRLLYQDPSQWSAGFLVRSLLILNNLIQAVIAIVVVLVLSLRTGIAAVAVVALVGYGSFRVIRPHLQRLTLAWRRAMDRTMVTASDVLAGLKDVKLSSREPYFQELFQSAYSLMSVLELRSSGLQYAPPVLLGTIGQVALVGIVLLLWSSGINSAHIADQLIVLYLIPNKIVPATSQIAGAVGHLWKSFPFIQGIHDLKQSLRECVAQEGGTETKLAVDQWSRVDLEDVRFWYPQGTQAAIDGVSISVERGKAYGMVGRSGSGKSTLVDLLIGLLRPTTGRILIDGRPLDELDRRSWQRTIGYVPQAPYMADDTVLANVAFGIAQAQADRAWVMQCLELANLQPLVEELPEGLHTRLGDRGIRLSGGQRQRLAIARALYSRPELLVLDEATSAVDHITEREILRALDNLHGRMTMVIIAHRLATVTHCDQLFVLERGRLVGQGTYDELKGGHALFQELAAGLAPSVPEATAV